jgi:hypothetical protein
MRGRRAGELSPGPCDIFVTIRSGAGLGSAWDELVRLKLDRQVQPGPAHTRSTTFAGLAL